MLKWIQLFIKKIFKHKFKILLTFFITVAILFGVTTFVYIFFNANIFCIDFTNKSQLLASLGIITSALIASFAVLTNIEIAKNKEEYQNLKYLSIQFLVLNEYISYSISWIEKFRDEHWKIIDDENMIQKDESLTKLNNEAKQENLRLEEFLNEIYNIKKEIFSRENSFLFKREFAESYNLSRIVSSIEEIYHFKNAYGLDSSTYGDIEDSLSGLSVSCMFAENRINQKLNVYEKNT